MRALTDVEIAGVFNQTFSRYRVVMCGGFDEPLYLPPSAVRHGDKAGQGIAEIRYTRDYSASALHEAAHWCIAGQRRRAHTDYGYFYVPPPRSAVDRRTFEDAELTAQALESILAQACGIEFRISADDLGTDTEITKLFARRVERYARQWVTSGLPPRASIFYGALRRTRQAVAGHTGVEAGVG